MQTFLKENEYKMKPQLYYHSTSQRTNVQRVYS